MRATLLFICFAALVVMAWGESCTTTADCKVTHCSRGSLACSTGLCTCVTQCTATHERCSSKSHCLHEDPCKEEGLGVCGLDSHGNIEYHCIDGLCHCGFS